MRSKFIGAWERTIKMKKEILIRRSCGVVNLTDIFLAFRRNDKENTTGFQSSLQ